VLAIWSAFSTPVLLIAFGLVFLPLAVSILGLVVIGGVLLAGLEALARRQLGPFLLTAAVAAVVLVAASALLRGFAPDWQVAAAVALFLVALGFLVVNLVELRRT
jgi:hypothetical protein